MELTLAILNYDNVTVTILIVIINNKAKRNKTKKKMLTSNPDSRNTHHSESIEIVPEFGLAAVMRDSTYKYLL